ncbi:MAG: proton-conducting transporter membrane subunit [Thiolinea sp.]
MFDGLYLALLLIPVLPLLAALWIALGFLFAWNRGESGEQETARSAVWAATAAFLLLLGVDVYAALTLAPGTLVLSGWLHSGVYQAGISFLLDGLSLSVATCFSLIILLTTRFSVNYLHREAGFQRFFLVLSLFHAAMLLITLGGNALLVFIGWELAGVSSWLLIAYAWQRKQAVENASRTFVTNRIGDAGFLLALFVALTYLGTAEWEALFVAVQDQPSMLVAVIVAGLTLAALAKSAQFPFSGWIARALEGPTPSSAVFYGSVMVHAGIFLLLRISPLLERLPFMGWLLLLVGGLTVSYAWVIAQVQTDIKSSLIFATLMQTGLMLMEMGLGWYLLASMHLILHASWRAYQFLHAPSFMQLTQAAAPPPPVWLQDKHWLHAAALHRFWLDPLADWLLLRPTRLLAQEAQLFDERVIDRLTGTPSQVRQLSTLAQVQALQQGQLHLRSEVGIGSGLAGKLMQGLAQSLEWFEEKLVLQGSSEGLSGLAGMLGQRVEQVESYLRQPRYLLVLIAATLVFIL